LRSLLEKTAAVIEPSQRARDQDVKELGLPAGRAEVVPGAVDVSRFDPVRVHPAGRNRLSLPDDAFLIGIVARLQTHRHYDDLFEGFKKFHTKVSQAHLVIVGRGTKAEEVGRKPIERHGLEGHVHITGYLDGDDDVGMIGSFDAGVFLAPGTDGTCRAVREMMAMGVPMVVSDRGMLPEIVTDGAEGIVCSGAGDDLAAAFTRLYRQRGERLQMGRRAREAACSRYALRVQAAKVASLYRRVLREHAS